jgi:hypothetical protein
MQNVEMKIVGSKLVIEVDLSKKSGPSKSGKTVMVASTQGNAQIPGHAGHFVGLNVFAYPDKR